jgi:SAM-dependent methyltransferase
MSHLSWEQSVVWLRNQPDQQELVKACFYDDPPDKSAERFYRSTEWKAVRELLAPQLSGKVLDIGAGRGISSYAFARDGWNVTALEPDPSNIVGAGAMRQIIRPGIDITIVEERGEKLPFADNSFDLVYGRAVLHHADDLATFCYEAARVLKPGGFFLFTREHVLSKSSDLDKFLDSHPLHFLYRGEHAYTLTEYLHAIQIEGRMKCKKILAPYSSDINLFPSSQKELFRMIRKNKWFPCPGWFIKAAILPKMEMDNNTPGRLFSFFGNKI